MIALGSSEAGPSVGFPDEGQGEVIDFLSRPAAYGAAGGAVERIDTHISVVFLVGDRAYKLKRAVTFGYLDYSTAAKRRRFCEAEVAVNRRTAGDMYIGVVPVRRGANGRLSLDEDGEPVDWLVVMRRFDQDALLDRIAQKGKLTLELAARIADSVAEFHIAAERRPGGGGEAMRWVIDSNRREVDARVPGIFDVRPATRFAAACDNALRHTASLLDERARRGMVRHCHGDLHLRNIFMRAGRPTPFDAIEFNDALTDIDVLYDLAFLIMDLEHRNLRDEANAMLNRYLAATGDYGGLAAMPLFLACRAAIRAHTAAAATDRQTDTRTAAARRDEARAYLSLAMAFLKPAPVRLVAVGGLSGTGKSVLARALAPSLGRAPGAVHLQSDVIRKRLFGREPESNLDQAAYAPEVSREVYQRLRDQAAQALAAGQTVIADATHLDADARAAIETVAAEAGIPFTGLWLEAEPDILRRRIEARRGDTSDATVAVLRDQLAHAPGAVGWARLRCRGTPDETLALARRILADSRSAARV